MTNLFLLGLLTFFVFTLYTSPFTLVNAQELSIASVYEISDQEAVSGDILINAGEKGLIRTNVTYDAKIFGVLEDNPLVVLREATPSGKPVIRTGDTKVNVTDYNGEIKKGDYVTTSPLSGKGMQAGQSGYTLGIATEDAIYGSETQQVEGKQVKSGTVSVALRIEYAELSTARSNVKLLNDLNAAFFRSVQDPEKFTLVIRYIIAGIIAILAFVLGFFSITRSISKAVEAIGRNPLAKTAILASVGFQIGLAVVGGIIAAAIVFIIIRL